MRCSSCGHENRAGAHFCEACGSPLSAAQAPDASATPTPEGIRECPTCGAETRPGLRFCEQCATPLPQEPPIDAVRPMAERPREPERTMKPSPATPMPPASSREPPAAETVCVVCGNVNREGLRFCEHCGKALLPRPGRPVLRVLGALVTVAMTVLVAIAGGMVIRYAVSFVMPDSAPSVQSAITAQEAVGRANTYIAQEWPDFSAAHPTASLAMYGDRAVFVVQYVQSVATPRDPATTLIVLVDAETGQPELLTPDHFR